MELNPIKQELIKKVEETTSLFNQVKKQAYVDHFYEFNRDILGWPDLYEPLHRKVCDFVQDNAEKKKLLILLPRGTFKSSIVTVGYTLWRLARDPQERILIANATYPMATQFLGQIKQHLTKNETFKSIFGDFSAGSDSWREDRILVAREKSYEQKEPTVWAYGMGGNLVGSHFNIAILDDVVARDNIGTKEQIDKVKNFYKDVLDLIDPVGGVKRMIIIGTAWHWDDLYAWIQNKENDLLKDFEVLKMPAYEGDWGTGKLLFPTKLNWKTLEELKRHQRSDHFSAQYLLNPIPAEDQVFREFKYYEETDLRGVELKKFISVDPAISEEKTADYTAMVCVGVDKNNDWYILDLYRKRVQPKELIDYLFFWNEKWKPVSVGIETVSYQKALQYFLYDEMKRRNQMIPITELGHTDRSKDERIRGLQPRYAMGSIFHPMRGTNPTVEYLEDELKRYPRGQNDDLVDALASQLELAFPPKSKEESRHVRRNVYPA